MAKVGDSYNCTMRQFMDVTPDKIYQKPLQEFTFVMNVESFTIVPFALANVAGDIDIG